MSKFINLDHWKSDLSSGIVVFLVAVPLCLGIALASGANLYTGLIAGIIGGIIVGSISNSALAVSGPAAGLAVIVMDSIQKLGGFQLFLVAVVIAGIIQLILGFVRAGFIADFFPSSVIKGMLAAIGVILILKQIPHALGDDLDYFGDLGFLQLDNNNTFTELWNALRKINISALLISSISLLVLIVWPKTPMNNIKLLPAPLIVVVLGILLNFVLGKINPSLGLAEEHLVQIPLFSTFDQFISNFTTPEWSGALSYKVFLVAFTLAIVASLETLLSIEAIDKLDPMKRSTNTNLELKAQGIGNIVSGLIGGLPITAVIVRGSANVAAGAKTKKSTIIHGVLLVLCLLTIPGLLNKIPYASLAAILLMIGYKLTDATLIREMIKKGYIHAIPFFVTIIAINLSDLLIGICIGLVVAVIFILIRNYKNPFALNKEEENGKRKYTLKLASEVSFLNKSVVSSTLKKVKPDSELIIDASNSLYIDDDVLEIIEDYKIQAEHKKIDLELIGFKESYAN